jgi:hypothetical protein
MLTEPNDILGAMLLVAGIFFLGGLAVGWMRGFTCAQEIAERNPYDR